MNERPLEAMDARAEDELHSAVRSFVAELRGTPIARLNDDYRLLEDDGCDGADATELMAAFAERFGVDMTAYQHHRHFDPEGMDTVGCLSSLLLWPFVFAPSRFRPREAARAKLPVTMRDLMDAAKRKAWPDWHYQQQDAR